MMKAIHQLLKSFSFVCKVVLLIKADFGKLLGERIPKCFRGSTRQAQDRARTGQPLHIANSITLGLAQKSGINQILEFLTHQFDT